MNPVYSEALAEFWDRLRREARDAGSDLAEPGVESSIFGVGA
jgi:hypothetical protein